MSSLRPPSSPSPGPSPVQGQNGKSPSARSSMGSAARPSAAAAPDLSLPSPRPGGRPPSGRPSSELLGSATPEADAIDQWFENFHRYEVTLEEIAAASFDVNFKEELSTIEQWFKIRFLITVLQQMARADPMTALLSPAVGGSIQSQMEAKLTRMNLKSPGLKSTLQLHKYTPNFEGTAWKEVVMMDEQALEAQGVAALAARRKMLKTFEVMRKKMDIDDPTAPPLRRRRLVDRPQGHRAPRGLGWQWWWAVRVIAPIKGKQKSVLFLVVKAASSRTLSVFLRLLSSLFISTSVSGLVISI
ncbi:hypothetical protein EDB85DRAFT_2295854 [Lactarius pseudohatsudake]|nr:hypothetical protein EDB85DRAFT_2295854 [Lactarius pseudohatsudake]